jgi:DNA-binding LacI/PurR family transcriptional regulator
MTEKNEPNGTEGEHPARPITLRDIARELGVSHVTVSLALRNHPRISEATRKRVQQKAEEMDYHPDPMLSALSHYRLRCKEKPAQATLAWINPLQYPERLHNYGEFSLYWRGAQEVARRLGFHLEEFTTKEFPLHRLNTIFRARNIRGLLIAPISEELVTVDWDEMPWQDYAAIHCGRNRQGPPLHLVTSAQTFNAKLAFEKATAKGYKRIGFVSQPDKRKMFLDGYLRSQVDLPRQQQLPVLLIPDAASDQEKAKLAAWLTQNNPDAIMTANPNLPALLMSFGYRVPEDIGIATMSIHDTPINTGIDQNPEEIGKIAVRTLVSLLNEHELGIPKVRNQILVDGNWVEGSMLPDRN